MPYRASEGGGLFGTSVYNPRPMVNVGDIIDSISNSASSAIRTAYARRMAQNQMDRENQQLALQQKREQDAQDLENRKFTYQQQRDQATENEKALVDRRSAIERGFTPAHTEVQPAPTTASVGPLPQAPSAVRSAMAGAPGAAPSSPTSPAPLPAASMASVRPQAPATSPLPASTLASTTVPESFDPTKGAKFTLEKERAEEMGNRLAQRQQDQVALRKYGEGLAENLAAFKNGLPKQPGTSGGGRAITGNKLEDARNKAAAGLIDYTHGSYDDAAAYLASDDGKALRDEGVKPEHLMYAHGKYAEGATAQAMRLQTGATGMEPKEAVGAVNKTRQLIGGPARKPAAGAPPVTPTPAPPAAAVPTPTAPRMLAAPAKPGAPVAAPKPAPAPTPKPGAAKRAPLSAAAIAKAQSEPEFAAFLKGKGYQDTDWAKK